MSERSARYNFSNLRSPHSVQDVHLTTALLTGDAEPASRSGDAQAT